MKNDTNDGIIGDNKVAKSDESAFRMYGMIA